MRHHPFPPFPPRGDARGAFGPRPGGFGEFPPPGWGPRGPFGPGGRGRGHGRGPHGGRRGKRGDVRAAILALLVEQPRHGYEIISEIGERSGGFWRPSPGSVYPTLQLMADEGLVVSRDESGKKLFELTDQGRAAAERLGDTPPWEQIAHDVDPSEVDLRKAGATLAAAAFQVSQAGTPDQKKRAVTVLNEARRSLYTILGEVEADDEDEE